MKTSEHHLLNIRSDEPPIVEIDHQIGAVYVYFKRGVKIAQSIVRSEWPHIVIDLDGKAEVVGIEGLGLSEFTITTILQKADVRAPARILAHTRYLQKKSGKLVGHR